MANLFSSREFSLAMTDCPILQIEGWDGALRRFEASVARMLGMALPAAVGETAGGLDFRAARVAPRRFWLIAGVGGELPVLGVDPDLGCSVALGEGRVRFAMAGPRTSEILSRCLAVDWRSPAAAPGRAMQTSFHHVPVLFLRTGAVDCELIAPRSFARSLSDWIADSAA